MPTPWNVKEFRAKFKKGIATEYGGTGGIWCEAKNYVELRKEVHISVLSPDPAQTHSSTPMETFFLA